MMAVSTLTLRWHRRFALTLGIIVVTQGVTGAIAQNRFWLMLATNPALFSAEGSGPAAKLGDDIQVFQQDQVEFRTAST